MQDQQQQQFGYNAYSGSQMYDGWPGMALKQIMGQIDLLNFQHSNHGNSAKWPLKQDLITNANNTNSNNNNNNGYMDTHCGDGVTMPQQNPFKTAGYDCGQLDNDNSAAWLGPQLWNRRIGVDISSCDNSNHGSSGSDHIMFDNMSTSSSSASSSAPLAKIKTEMTTSTSTPDIDLSTWYNVDIGVDHSSSGESTPNRQDDDFSAADLALASAPGLNFDPRTRCFTPEELKPQPIIRKRRKVSHRARLVCLLVLTVLYIDKLVFAVGNNLD